MKTFSASIDLRELSEEVTGWQARALAAGTDQTVMVGDGLLTVLVSVPPKQVEAVLLTTRDETSGR